MASDYPRIKIAVAGAYHGAFHVDVAMKLRALFDSDGVYNAYAWLEVDGTH